MNLLAIDTSTDCISVALSIKNELQSIEEQAKQQHAQLLLPLIEQLLARAACQLKQLDGIIYGQGPGSFTGLRIACSVAKGLAYSQDLPLFPVSSLAAIAAEAQYQFHLSLPLTSLKPDVLALLDARMNQVYWAYYKHGLYEAIEQVAELKTISLQAKTPLILAGVGYESYLDQLSAAIQARLVSQMVVYPSARAMIRLVLGGKYKAISAEEALPVYVRNQIT